MTKGSKRVGLEEQDELEALLNPWPDINTAPKDKQIILRRGDHVAPGSWLQYEPTKPVWNQENGEYLGETAQADNSQWIGYGFTPDEQPTHWQPL